LSIKHRLIIYVSLLMALAITFVLVPTLYLFMGTMERTYEQQAEMGVAGLDSIIEDYKGKASGYATVFAQHPGVASAVAQKNKESLVKLLGPLAQNAKLDSVTVSDQSGIVIARTHDSKSGDNVTNQFNVREALRGTVVASVEPGTVVKFSARAGAPVRDESGKVIGVITIGYNIDDKFVDEVKRLYGVDATLFLQDERVATTIIQDGKRVVGTKLNEAIAEKVLKQGQKYNGRTSILGREYMTAYQPLMGADNKPQGVIFAGQDIESATAVRNKVIAITSIIALCVLGMGMILTFFMARRMINPLARVAQVAGKVAKGDLTHTVTMTSHDEIGTLAKSFNDMIAEVRGLVSNVIHMVETVAASSQELTASAQQSAASSECVSGAIIQIAKDSDKEAASATRIAEAAEGISQNTKRVATTAIDVSKVAQDTSQEAEQGRKVIDQAIVQMHKIGQDAKTVQDSITELAQGSLEISEIVSLISTIAGQTNLLALNAAIEAARAGESGRGFAVVAEEVRKLAEESEQAAQKITALIKQNQTNMEQVVVATQSSTTGVSDGVTIVNSAGDIFRKIADAIIRLSGQSKEMSQSIDEIAAGNQTLVGEIKDIDQLSKAVAVKVDSVSSTVEEQSASAEEIASASQGLAKLATELRDTVSKFRIN